MVISNVCADLLQPIQGDELSSMLHLVSKCLREKWRFRTVTVKIKAPNHISNYKGN